MFTTACVASRLLPAVEEAVDASDDGFDYKSATQRQLNRAMGAVLSADAAMRYFTKRTACRPDQCVRYEMACDVSPQREAHELSLPVLQIRKAQRVSSPLAIQEGQGTCQGRQSL